MTEKTDVEVLAFIPQIRLTLKASYDNAVAMLGDSQGPLPAYDDLPDASKISIYRENCRFQQEMNDLGAKIRSGKVFE